METRLDRWQVTRFWGAWIAWAPGCEDYLTSDDAYCAHLTREFVYWPDAIRYADTRARAGAKGV